MKEEALALAVKLDEKKDVFTGSLLEDSSAMIRRLVEELNEKDKAINDLVSAFHEMNKD